MPLALIALLPALVNVWIGTNTASAPGIDDTAAPVPRKDHACDGFGGIYHIQMGDIGGAAGTIFFQFVIGQILWAEQNNLKPFVHFNNVSHVVYDPLVHGKGKGVVIPDVWTGWKIENRSVREDGHWRDRYPGSILNSSGVKQETLYFPGTGVWNSYFEPVSDYVPGDRSCMGKKYVTLDLELITPGIHGFAPWAPKCWRYHYLPDYVTQPHVPLADWLRPQRKIGARVVKDYIRVLPHLQTDEQYGLGLHIRHSDKAAGRRVVAVSEFLPYVQAFVAAGGESIYLATDSTLVWQEIQSTWPPSTVARITYTPDLVRSSDEKAVFDLDHHDRTNQEVLRDIVKLSKCRFLIHGLSAVSEAAIWMNIELDERSINLEDDDRASVAMFGTMVQMSLRGDEFPQKKSSENTWWQLEPSNAARRVSHTACEKYDGALLISSVGADSMASGAFFTSILNQLIYAEQNNLIPYVHLSKKASNIYDEVEHGRSDESFEMLFGMNAAWMQGGPAGIPLPGRPKLRINELRLKTFSLEGTGIWESYFEPVSEFRPGDTSCRVKPLVTMDERLVVPGMQSFWKPAIRPWRFDAVPDELWQPNGTSLQEWLRPMRKRAHELTRKYFRPQAHLKRRAETVNPAEEVCLGVHLRNSEKKGRYRRKLKAPEFLEYMEAFVRAGGNCIYIASDSHRTLQYIQRNFPEEITSRIRTQGNHVVRTFKESPTHTVGEHHRVNSETIVDILALARCQLLLHGFSTTSEAAIYMNNALHGNSVNLEDPDRMAVDVFERLAVGIVNRSKAEASNSASNGTDLYTMGPIEELRYSNITLLYRNNTRTCQRNAIVYLAQKTHSSYGRDSYEALLQSLDLLYKNYLSIRKHMDNTDLFIFHTGDYSMADFEALESRYGNSFAGMLRLVDLSASRYWSRPPSVANDNATQWHAYPAFSEGYRHMMNWFGIEIWDYFLNLKKRTGCRYQYIMRLDEDSLIHSPIRYNIFDYMRKKNFVYGYRMCAYEMKKARFLWTAWTKRHADFSPKRQITHGSCGFYNNFFVADASFFQSAEVKSFLHGIKRQGAIYRRRLGDLLVHTMVVYAYADPSRVHRFLDFTYEHGTVNASSGCLQYGGIQAGYYDENASATLEAYYDKFVVDRHCPINATFLSDADLSPTYAHVGRDWKEKLSLHTITAGSVELPGQGIHSG